MLIQSGAQIWVIIYHISSNEQLFFFKPSPLNAPLEKAFARFFN